MEHGPLPPHERTWRHPSELGPTRADVDLGSHNHLAALALGMLAVFAVAGMVVAMTPRTSPGQMAASATTTPFTTITTIATTDGTDTAPGGRRPVTTVRSVRTDQSGRSVASGVPVVGFVTSFTSFPHAITSTPPLSLDGTEIARGLPADTDTVYVHTDAVTYRLPWAQVPALGAPDGSVVFDSDGCLVAQVRRGALVTIVDE